MTQTCNLNAVRDAGVATAASVPGSRRSRKKEQAPRRASSRLHQAPPSGIEVSTGVTAAPPPVSSEDTADKR